jgi:F-type H+-transporting ATPase subunit b
MLGPVSISIPTLVIELVIFVLMVYAMETLVFDPIRRAWAERDRRIQEGLAASNLGRDEAEQARAAVRDILTQARRRAQQDIDAATARGGQVRDEMVARATEEFRRIVAVAREEIDAERARSAEALQTRVIDIALQAASRVTGQTYEGAQVRELAAAVVSREGLR